MAIQHAQSGVRIDLTPLGAAISSTKTATLAKTSTLELIRLALPAGKVIPEHKVAGEITFQCLEGEIQFTASGKTQLLTGGTMVWLSGNEPHAVRAVTDASALVTIVLR